MIHVESTEDTLAFPISTRLLMQEALRRGYQLYFFAASPTTNSGITRAVKKDREIYFKSTCPITTPTLGYFAAQDKAQTYSLLSAQSINMPFTQILTPQQSAEEAFTMLQRFDSLVVKPVALNHGDGITVGVNSKEYLKKAVDHARKAGGPEMDVLIQQKIEGREFRFLVVDGKVAAIASRRPPTITGDGTHTIDELIEEKNKDPRRGEGHQSELTRIDKEEVRLHKGEDFLGDIPEKGLEVEVLHTTNLSRGGEAVDYTDTASKALKKLAVDAAQASFLSVAGVDIITNDISAETVDDSFVIEVNLIPGIRMHQYPSVGEKRDVAKVIFKSFEKHTKPVDKKVKVIGRAERVKIPAFYEEAIPARIDTGAVISALWASQIKETDQGLEFVLFDEGSPLFTGKKIIADTYSKRIVASSMGHSEERFVVKTPVTIKGKTIGARFTLANRATQTYPILIGRNVLRNNFIVDVYMGKPDRNQERAKRQALNQMYKEGEK